MIPDCILSRGIYSVFLDLRKSKKMKINHCIAPPDYLEGTTELLLRTCLPKKVQLDMFMSLIVIH